MKVVNLSEGNSIMQQFLSELRDVNVQKDSMRFRKNIERIGEIMAYEVSKTFTYENLDVQTPLAVATMPLPQNKVVLATIFRAGLPLHQGFFNYFDKAENAFISAYRRYKDEATHEIEIVREYVAAPQMEGKTLIMVDPMLATGGSMQAGYEALLSHGTPAVKHFCCVMATQKAIDFLQTVLPEDATLWCAVIDPILNDKKYIVPGLGDAGDLCFGEKL